MDLTKLKFEINNDRDYGTPGESYYISDILDKELTELEIPETYEGKPVGSFRPPYSAVYPNVKSIISPHSKIGLRVSSEAFPNLEKIEVQSFIGTSSGRYTVDGVLYYGNPERKMNGLILYPPYKQGKEIILPRGTYLSDGCFSGAKYLEKIILPPDLHNIPDGAFYNVENLKEIDIPCDVGDIGNDAFAHCHSLKKVTFHAEESYSGLAVIGGGVFNDCTSLEEIRLPSTIRMTNGRLFSGCTSLKKVEGRFSGYRCVDGVMYAASMFGDLLHLYYFPAAKECENDTYQVIDEAEYIHCGAFYDTRLIKKVILPKGIHSIEDGSFSTSSSIEEIIYQGTEEDWEKIEKPGFPTEINVTFMG